ncbi:ABC transporter ATP-binding protein [Lactobacillus delbrueckii]|uniref:ABC transporter ATP-binding protein n=1 Tax=Lactobacillus delbrueckii TaxID=1584 RepID=UPI00069B2A82|nr:ATP-binding cassette domain-containing protein [Lactobacillus delbrueckii]APP09420.1 ABC transporter ATP-binding protein [Lactobacillus delbrueckii subsp. delbrueckii DSM 20074 = JCM 1012]KNZ38436.1 ABC transporter ATP-binding protein [Lactobacillus delbrueckii subsp. delbrueckii]MCD5450973.1 ATP-binding cassette domain-containing protein [Lactobacillus delbrueckii subsp. lactis]MCT3493057.1 ATP-binding cassette domain-containing protein [Lactobacillus delbrueckii]MCT3521178.1 ATP-binding c
MTSQNLLELTDLEVVVGRGTSEENKILGKLSLKIKPGDFICLLGGNGAGKSTLLNVLAGAIQPTSGKILHAGEDISKESEVKRSSYIARVFQDPKLGTAPRMTVAENLLLAAKRGQKRGLKLRRLKENIPAFKEALKKVNPDLAGKLDLPVDQLSGGQRQALSFVMATYNKPELLLLDEHTAALDPRSSRKLMEATDEQIRAKKITAVMITHHMEDALKYGNRLLVLDHGQISHDYQGQAKQDLTLQDLAALFD